MVLIAKNKVAAAKGPQATVAQGQRSIEAVKDAVERGRSDAEAEAEARKEARRHAPSITAGNPGPGFVAPRG